MNWVPLPVWNMSWKPPDRSHHHVVELTCAQKQIRWNWNVLYSRMRNCSSHYCLRACVQHVYKLSTGCLQVVYNLSTTCLQVVYKLSTSCLHVVYNTSTNGSDFQMQWQIMNTNASPAQNHLTNVTIIFLQQLMPTAPPRNGRSHFTNTWHYHLFHLSPKSLAHKCTTKNMSNDIDENLTII